MHRVKLTIRLVLNSTLYENISDLKSTFIDFETTKDIPFPPSKDYSLCFSKKKVDRQAFGNSLIPSDVYIVPSEEPKVSNIYWLEKTNSFHWEIAIWTDAFSAESEASELIEEGWEVKRCVVLGKKTSEDEFLKYLSDDRLAAA